ncbi:MAG TPA: hypothetical protein PLE43_05545 [Alphaproteobacteria bacterium]|nr:hypothetical protein [Alphaproteobacteria bacterium]
MYNKKPVFLIFLIASIVLLCGQNPIKQQNYPVTYSPIQNTRSFYMGFSNWPPDFDMSAIAKSLQLTNENSDMRLVHMDGGVPWVEMGGNQSLPKRIVSWWDYIRNESKGKKIFVTINPLNFERDGLALYANEKDDDQPLPDDWKNLSLDSDKVKTAYLSYAEEIISYWNPDYLAIGVEVNISVSKNLKTWREYLALHKFIYTKLKERHPQLPVFATVQMEHFNGLNEDAKGKEDIQKREVGELMKYSDIAALSMYPYASEEIKFNSHYLDGIRTYKKPMAISETGWPSKNFKVFFFPIKGSPQAQYNYLKTLLTIANRDHFLFVINWTNVDYNKMLDQLPWLMKEIAKSWVYNGLWNKDFEEKPALDVWQHYLGLKKVPE